MAVSIVNVRCSDTVHSKIYSLQFILTTFILHKFHNLTLITGMAINSIIDLNSIHNFLNTVFIQVPFGVVTEI